MQSSSKILVFGRSPVNADKPPASYAPLREAKARWITNDRESCPAIDVRQRKTPEGLALPAFLALRRLD